MGIGGAWAAQSMKHPTLDFGSGQDVMVEPHGVEPHGIKPCKGLGVELSVSLSFKKKKKRIQIKGGMGAGAGGKTRRQEKWV